MEVVEQALAHLFPPPAGFDRVRRTRHVEPSWSYHTSPMRRFQESFVNWWERGPDDLSRTMCTSARKTPVFGINWFPFSRPPFQPYVMQTTRPLRRSQLNTPNWASNSKAKYIMSPGDCVGDFRDACLPNPEEPKVVSAPVLNKLHKSSFSSFKFLPSSGLNLTKQGGNSLDAFQIPSV